MGAAENAKRAIIMSTDYAGVVIHTFSRYGLIEYGNQVKKKKKHRPIRF